MFPNSRAVAGSPATRRLLLAALLLLAAFAVDLAGGAARARLADWGRRTGEIRQWRDGFARERARLAEALDALPDRRAALEVFDATIALAKDSGVSLAGLRSLGEEGRGRLRALRFEATARGSYGGLRAFLRALESSPLPLYVESIEHTAQGAAPGELSLVVTAAALHRGER